MFAKYIKNIRNDEAGQTLIEYALIAALISVVSIVIMTTTGTSISTVFQTVVDAL